MFDTGTTTFMLLATSLVMLMTPGLAFFYGGLACKRNILGVMIQSFVSLGITTILWWAFGYSLCFSGGEGAIIGNFDKAFLNGVGLDSMYSPDKRFPELVFISYQMMFAIITPALITGAFANRVTFKAYILFLIVWQILVYYPFVHMVWGGGLLAEWGVLDFAGGIVVHATAGAAALASVFYVGKRRNRDSKPNSIPLVAVGTGLLWFGWYGFNAGSELSVNGITAMAFLNTDIAASVAAITWLAIEWVRTDQKKPTFIGLLTGSIAGLATITPAAGYVTINTAVLIGVIAAIGCYIAVKIKDRFQWDDALDVWGVHGVGGVLGTLMLGLFATKAVNANGADGLFYGDSSFLFKQVVAIIFSSVYAFGFTYGMLWLINKITPVKVSVEDEEMGLDAALHGETARDSY
ncbi:ammonium transporter [Plebeiibacterium marinum]|uniref:Ammonium transporter n=1 Tax=Plebeiibacterium marinum TaxID=2992111 RepID=A0AAE3MFG1_9BACT|nr:ammonium transporter [Plebeiobacterium marinum]MCW3806586.1 ammonium transporter [Plebeiobacterium marinum]